jgi:two-component system nitrogen regulation response regulator NtrX
LRVLQENKFQRVGGETESEADVRVIAATNKNIEEEIKAGRFRSDLFFRLNVIPLYIPPLRERKDDIPLLVDYFIKIFGGNTGRLEIDGPAMNVFKNYDWPGNVRELKNIIERFSILNINGKITEKDVISELKIDNRVEKENIQNAESNENYDIHIDEYSFKQAKENFERAYLIRKLKENKNNITKTAKIIGMSRRNLQKRINCLNINQ